MKYLVTHYIGEKEKERIRKQDLYCYDLRSSDDGEKIATIEKSVLVNRVGSIITNEEIQFQKGDFIDYNFFEKVNETVSTIEELKKSKNKKQDKGAR